MTEVGVFGLLLGLVAGFKAFVHPTRVRIVVFVLAYLLHIAATLLYFELVKNGGSDAALYYYDPLEMYKYQGFKLNTVFVVYVVQIPKSIFGGTYLDYFLVFQAIGFWGLAALMRTFEEIYQEIDVTQPVFTYTLFFLPSLHYWTSAIGKDSLFFFGICITLWAAMRYRKRLIPLSIGMLLMFAIRPHIAVAAGAAFALAVLIDRNTRGPVKAIIAAISLAGAAFAIATVWSTFGVDLTNVDTYTDMLAGQKAMATADFAGRSAVTGSYPIRLLSLLFRPLFFDASGALGLIVSVENVLLLLILLLMAIHPRATLALVRTVPFVRYALISSSVILLTLAISYFNVGLGIRQKATMILPGILVAFVALQALIKARRTAALPEQLPAAQPRFS
ncbi:MAG: hypothetical protein M3448_05950 [Pseudomonadota bacterium]|nr:hypothetical protein [Pseudomonadota bacterium]